MLFLSIHGLKQGQCSDCYTTNFGYFAFRAKIQHNHFLICPQQPAGTTREEGAIPVTRTYIQFKALHASTTFIAFLLFGTHSQPLTSAAHTGLQLPLLVPGIGLAADVQPAPAANNIAVLAAPFYRRFSLQPRTELQQPRQRRAGQQYPPAGGLPAAQRHRDGRHPPPWRQRAQGRATQRAERPGGYPGQERQHDPRPAGTASYERTDRHRLLALLHPAPLLPPFSEAQRAQPDRYRPRRPKGRQPLLFPSGRGLLPA